MSKINQSLTLYHTIPTFNDPERDFENILALSPFPTKFSMLLKTNISFWVTFILSSAIALNLDYQSLKILLFGKELRLHMTTN